MIVPDTNLIVYAYNDAAPRHEAARRWWEGLVNRGGRYHLPDTCRVTPVVDSRGTPAWTG